MMFILGDKICFSYFFISDVRTYPVLVYARALAIFYYFFLNMI